MQIPGTVKLTFPKANGTMPALPEPLQGAAAPGKDFQVIDMRISVIYSSESAFHQEGYFQGWVPLLESPHHRGGENAIAQVSETDNQQAPGAA